MIDEAGRTELSTGAGTLAAENGSGRGSRRGFIWLCCFLALIAGTLIVYSQTWSFVWDAGFHLIAASLIKNGRTPYIDFCFPQTPLNAYFNAVLMWLWGENWRIPQLAATLFSIGAMVLSVDFVLRYFPKSKWRLFCAATVAAFVGLNSVVLQFGTVAQAYGSGLFFSVTAFRLALLTEKRYRLTCTLAAGLFAAAAAACTLLTAPVLAVLFVWIVYHSAARERWSKSILFIVGAVWPFVPVLLLWLRSPSVVFFNVVRYQAIFRRYNWNGPTEHDFDALGAWLDSTQALLLGLLFVAGLLYLIRESNWTRDQRSPFYLAACIALADTAYIATAHPTFERYFIVAIPFWSIVAAVGLYATGAKLAHPDRPFWPSAVVLTLLTLAAGKALFDDRDSTKWKDYEKIAQKIAKVTPRHALLYADEVVYFLLERTPPAGMEFSYSHKLELSPADESRFHIVSEKELNEQVKAGTFHTVQSCNDDRINEMKLPDLFAHEEDFGDCSVFWDWKKPRSVSRPAS